MDRFLIAPLNEGLRTDLKSWMIPDDAYAELNNAYIFRGRLKKRVGSLYTGSSTTGEYGSRLRVLLPATQESLGNTDGSGDISGTVTGSVFTVGQKFNIGSEIFTVVVEGTPGVMTTTGSATTHTFNTTTGAFVIAGAAHNTPAYFYPDGGGHGAPVAGIYYGLLPGNKFLAGQQFTIGSEVLTIPSTGSPVTMLSTGTYVGMIDTSNGLYTFDNCAAAPAVYYYPSEPVMGLTQYEKGTIHNQTAYAFDTQFYYKYSGSSWVREGVVFWSGTNKNLVCMANWDGVNPYDVALFATNFNYTTGSSPTGDRMVYYDGTSWRRWLNTQVLSTGETILTCRIIIPFKGRLLLLNTIELNAAGNYSYSYTNRVRYSQFGSPLATYAFYEPNETNWLGGGFIDGPTEEDIIGCELIRDRCIVFFERSTWELAYTGNESLPFTWQQVNTELGSESQFSTIPFDKFILNVGPNGIQSCNGINVDRIDEKIPDEVFNIRISNEGMHRVIGIRDYYTEMVYWTYPTDDNKWALTYPNKTFVFNYRNGSWAINDDTFTAFGYWEQQTDITWAEIQGSWGENNQSWTSNVNASQFRHVIAGNQHGYIVELSRETSSQVGTLSITNITYTAATQTVELYVKDHNLAVGDFIRLQNCNGTTITGTYKIFDIQHKDKIILNGITSDPGTYDGGGSISRVYQLNILSKEWNPYKGKNRGFHLQRIDFAVKRTSLGQVTVDYYPSHSGLSLLTESQSTGTAISTSILETTPYSLVPLESQQRLLWHPIYFNAEGDSVQIRIYFSDEQLLSQGIAESDFTIEGLILYTQPTRVK